MPKTAKPVIPHIEVEPRRSADWKTSRGKFCPFPRKRLMPRYHGKSANPASTDNRPMKSPLDLLIERRDMYRHALRFERASDVLFLPENHPELTVPAVVNSAFALEVYLKCLRHIETDERPKNAHLLKTQLFDQLTTDHQSRIEAVYKLRPDRGNTTLHQHLKASDDAYPHWRYLYEKETQWRVYAGRMIIPCVKQIILEDEPQVALP
jgi:hypothetical protein